MEQERLTKRKERDRAHENLRKKEKHKMLRVIQLFKKKNLNSEERMQRRAQTHFLTHISQMAMLKGPAFVKLACQFVL